MLIMNLPLVMAYDVSGFLLSKKVGIYLSCGQSADFLQPHWRLNEHHDHVSAACCLLFLLRGHSLNFNVFALPQSVHFHHSFIHFISSLLISFVLLVYCIVIFSLFPSFSFLIFQNFSAYFDVLYFTLGDIWTWTTLSLVFSSLFTPPGK